MHVLYAFHMRGTSRQHGEQNVGVLLDPEEMALREWAPQGRTSPKGLHSSMWPIIAQIPAGSLHWEADDILDASWKSLNLDTDVSVL